MYGYDPKQRGPETGSWSEVFAFVRAAAAVLGPIMAVLLGLMAAFIAMLALSQINGWLALVPFALLAVGLAFYLRRERRNQAREMDKYKGTRS
jgi:membrane protein implicated in regulation of membrane protease activity